ncbi:MAG: hypothetical protein HY647_06075, partial [Acidobacteria bacterium]|nr:hypothetical protein [Acidobacteriota bacterium]
IVRANLGLTEQPLDKQRWIFSGTLDQIREDVEGCRRIGAQEVFFDLVFSSDGSSLDRFLARMEQLRRLA